MHTTISANRLTCFQTRAAAQDLADLNAADDTDWTYTVEENLFGFFVAIYEGDTRIGTL